MAIYVDDNGVTVNLGSDKAAREIAALRRIRKNIVDAKNDRVGAVIIFKKGTSHEDAQRMLDLMGAKIIDKATAHCFDPSVGGPVWYIP